jgi:hypothetical protein
MTTPGEVAEAVRGLVGALTAVQSSDVTPMEATSSYLDPRVQVEQWEIHVAAMMKVGNLLIHDLAMARRMSVDDVLRVLGEWAACLPD